MTTYELVEGEIVERHIGEYKHSRLQVLVAGELGVRERAGRFHVLVSPSLKMRGTTYRYSIPDLCAMTQEADRDGIRPCATLAVETELVGSVDFRELFAQVDEPSE